jgi:sodium/hydrogen antiporter
MIVKVRHCFLSKCWMDSYLILITVIGLAALGMAWMPHFTKSTNISYAIIYVAAGALLYVMIDTLPFPNPLKKQESTLRLTEMMVIVSLMGTGLKIDQPFSFRVWRVPFKLVTITMLLSITAVAFLCHWMFSLDLAAALLMGAVLAPTDPVLASDVQVGPPLEKNKDNVRFSLTAEAGMNDGMAFPFTWLAIGLATTSEFQFQSWLLFDLLLKIVIGVLCGFIMGKVLAYFIFKVSSDREIFIRDGFVAISVMLVTYGVAELVHGYGFIAVFVSAITIRNYEIEHTYHRKLHSFTDQIERILLAIVLILFGGALVHGVLESISLSLVIFSLICIFIIRPLTTWIALIGKGNDLHRKEKFAISFFGIKGIGSFFYLAFAIREASFSDEKLLWSIVSCVVLFSIVIHGATATYTMKRLGDRFDTTDTKSKY